MISSRPARYVMGCILSAGREQKSYFNYISHASVLNATQRCCNKVNKIDCNKIKRLDRHKVQITCMFYQACGTRIQHEAKGTTETNNSNKSCCYINKTYIKCLINRNYGLLGRFCGAHLKLPHLPM